MVNKIYFFLFLILISACSKTEEQKLFKLLDPQESGINFENNLPFDEDFNVYKYRNFITEVEFQLETLTTTVYWMFT